ncbi:MAG: hypothetical protein WD512_06355 [Candidatus Paceibacterota bacterium]
MTYLIFVFILSFQVPSGDLEPDYTIKLNEGNQVSKNISLKVYNDIIIHDYDRDTFTIIDEEHNVSSISYEKTEFDLPVPVKNPVMISDFIQYGEHRLLVTETNTNSMYVIDSDNTFHKMASMETAPFYLHPYQSGVVVISNGLYNEYLSYYNSDFEKVHDVIIGGSFFQQGIKPINNLHKSRSFFIESDTIYIKNNDEQLLSCTIEEEIICKEVISAKEQIFIDRTSNGRFYFLENDKLFTGTVKEIAENKAKLNLNSAKHANYLYRHLEELYVFENQEIRVYN